MPTRIFFYIYIYILEEGQKVKSRHLSTHDDVFLLCSPKNGLVMEMNEEINKKFFEMNNAL